MDTHPVMNINGGAGASQQLRINLAGRFSVNTRVYCCKVATEISLINGTIGSSCSVYHLRAEDKEDKNGSCWIEIKEPITVTS